MKKQENFRQCVIFAPLNSDLKPSVRISIVYSSARRRSKPRYFEKLYIRLGTTVVSITLLPGRNLLRMFRSTLIALIITQRFWRLQVLNLSASTQSRQFSALASMVIRRYKNTSLTALLREVANSKDYYNLPHSRLGYRLNVDYIQDVKDLAKSLIFSEAYIVDSLRMLKRR